MTAMAVTSQIPRGLGATESAGTELGQLLPPHGESFDARAPRLVPDPGPGRHADRALLGNSHFGLDDILGPVAAAGRYVAGQREIGQRRKRDVMRAADAGFQHAAAPHRNALVAAEIMNAPRRAVAAHAAQLDIDDAAGALRNRPPCVFF